MIDGAPNKRRTILAKSPNFKGKQEVLSKYKARKLWTKGIFINEDSSEDTMEKCKVIFQKVKELRKEGEFAKVLCDRLNVRDGRPGLETAEEGNSSV